MSRSAESIMSTAVSLLCQRCGHRGSEDLALFWYAKSLKVVRKKDGSTTEREFRLCPDCASELGSDRKRAAFLRASLKE